MNQKDIFISHIKIIGDTVSLIHGYGVNIVDFNYYRGYLDVATDTIISGWAWNGFNDDTYDRYQFLDIEDNTFFTMDIPYLTEMYRWNMDYYCYASGNYYKINKETGELCKLRLLEEREQYVICKKYDVYSNALFYLTDLFRPGMIRLDR